MISRVPQKGSTWLTDLSLVTIICLPPKDPHNDDDENEEDEENDDEEEEEEPAVIREPDQCCDAVGKVTYPGLDLSHIRPSL